MEAWSKLACIIIKILIILNFKTRSSGFAVRYRVERATSSMTSASSLVGFECVKMTLIAVALYFLAFLYKPSCFDNVIQFRPFLSFVISISNEVFLFNKNRHADLDHDVKMPIIPSTS